MTAGQFWSILTRQWRLIIACFILVGIGTLVSSKLTRPQYQSVALVQVAVNSGATDINNLLASDQLVQTEAILATSDPVLREVASHYAGMNVDQLSKEVSAASKLNTQLFEIDVLDANSQRAAALANDIARTLIKQQFQMTQQETAQANFLLLVQPAQPASYPVLPNVWLNTGAGLAGGLFLGILLALLVAQLDPRVRTLTTIAHVLDQPHLATIWLTQPDEVVRPSEESHNAEAYRTLWANIELASNDTAPRSLLITSALAGEGKSAIAANLAISMAKAGKRTLLIDADMHHPTQHTQLGLTRSTPGLSDALLALRSSNMQPSPISRLQGPSASFSLPSFMHTVHNPDLWCMPAGTHVSNPSALLASKATRELFQAIRTSGIEMIIVDAPPLLDRSDAYVLAPKVDAQVLVVDATQANKKKLQQMLAMAQKTGTTIAGYVLNKQREKTGKRKKRLKTPDNSQRPTSSLPTRPAPRPNQLPADTMITSKQPV